MERSPYLEMSQPPSLVWPGWSGHGSRGRTVYYRVSDAHIRLLLDVAVEHYLHDHGDSL